MNDEELKKLWQEQPLREPSLSAAELISAMQNKTTQFRRTLRARDTGELWACAFVIIIFGFFFFKEREAISRVGELIVTGSTIFIAWKLLHARRTTPPAPVGATIVESLRAELNSVRTQSRLLGSVLWWYLLPPGIGLLVMTWGMKINLHAKIPAMLFYVGLYGFIYWLNQWARSKQLLPFEAQLESLLLSAQTGEPMEQTHVANLRPIVVSMAAADRVKPAEFKVAFWQLAIYGVPAFIGIWVFWTLGLTLDNEGRAKEQTLERFAREIPAEQTNRYSAVARKLVDLLNAGDHAAVQNLFNRRMSAALPPRKASEFFNDLAAQFGNIEKVDGPTGNGYGGWVAFRLHCQQSELTMSMALDEEDKISGLHFEPVHRLAVESGSVVPRIFSWQHLIWIGPFLLAGLLFCWILQKTTERAAGISALGIHLYRGQLLILWDEIKEVRPLRILNIRSLWLIRESGEKALVPWTSLERHSELKAAVERSAPENHPIRKHLSLL